MSTKFFVGQIVLFGRGNGEQTRGEVIKVNPTRLKVKTLESRGTKKAYPVGSVWVVPFALATPETGATASTPSTPKALTPAREAEILREAANCHWKLDSPEYLFADGERSRSAAHALARNLAARIKALEKELGHSIEFRFPDGEAFKGAPLGTKAPAKRTAAPAKQAGFKKGDRVKFTAKGSVRKGTVLRVSTKTLSVAVDGEPEGRYWRVAPSFLTAL